MAPGQAYVPPHLRRRGAGAAVVASKAPPVQAAFFGDSFVRLFGLVNNPAINVRAFKGASAKGLGKRSGTNDNRNEIRVFAESHGDEIDRWIFCFGSVDVHLSYYYKKFELQEDIDLDEIAQCYVEFVASLPIERGTRTVLGVYPSPLEDADVGASLICYGSLSEESSRIVMDSDDVKLELRQERVRRFNRTLAEHCRRHGLEYADMLEEMLDSSSNRILEPYRDVSNCNIHIVWETTILLWLDKWPWLRRLTDPGFEDKLRTTLKEYLKTKPWATRTHVSQNPDPPPVLRRSLRPMTPPSSKSKHVVMTRLRHDVKGEH